jgi:hypothetical protein
VYFFCGFTPHSQTLCIRCLPLVAGSWPGWLHTASAQKQAQAQAGPIIYMINHQSVSIISAAGALGGVRNMS